MAFLNAVQMFWRSVLVHTIPNSTKGDIPEDILNVQEGESFHSFPITLATISWVFCWETQWHREYGLSVTSSNTPHSWQSCFDCEEIKCSQRELFPVASPILTAIGHFTLTSKSKCHWDRDSNHISHLLPSRWSMAHEKIKLCVLFQGSMCYSYGDRCEMWFESLSQWHLLFDVKVKCPIDRKSVV